MPEGHSVHRIAGQFARHFVGSVCRISSPQGRFGDASLIDGHTIVRSYAVGKHLFLEFDMGDSLHVHLGIYGAWDFAGAVQLDDTVSAAGGRMGQTAGRGTVVGEHEDSLASIGAPRRTRLRMGEHDIPLGSNSAPSRPTPLGRYAFESSLPTLSPICAARPCARWSARRGWLRFAMTSDPTRSSTKEARTVFLARAKRTGTPIGRALMNQKIVAGIGNVYRAEMLFRARLSPYLAAKTLPDETLRALWADWVGLLKIGVKTGQMLTMDGLTPARKRAALAHREDRHWVYRRAGEPCRICGTPITLDIMEARKLYFCRNCQGVAT
jgi:endonuclease VIII